MSNRIPSTGLPATTGVSRVTDPRQRSQTHEKELRDYAPPHRAQRNYIPTPDALKNMIDRALEALSKGVYWDRGSIINIVL
ncbi:MAG: hypothetical protein MK052_08575 [Alphaproteobacteria bacterium]|nr:hypothetical protein [Alphaproteobacteria bacterium]